MKSPRETCSSRDKCGKTGHIIENGVPRRCSCLQLELNQKKLAEMYCENPVLTASIVTGGIEGKKEKEAKRKKETQQETVNIVTSVVYIPHKNQHP